MTELEIAFKDRNVFGKTTEGEKKKIIPARVSLQLDRNRGSPVCKHCADLDDVHDGCRRNTENPADFGLA